MAVVRTASLGKTYRPLRGDPVEALRGVDLSVMRGEIFGLLGPNGAGKTTLVKLLLGIAHPSAGQAWLLEQPITEHGARGRVGFLAENHRFPPYLTARQILDVYGAMSAVDKETRKERGDELLDLVGLAKWRDVRVRKYSKGMMQRLGLAQAMLNRPEVLFLDEPTDGVDPVGRREIRDILLRLRDEGTTIFLNSHLLGEVELVCSRVAILKQGELVFDGSIEHLTTKERTWELRCTPVPETLADPARTCLSARPMPEDNAPSGLERYHLLVDDREQLNEVLDQLRASGVEIDSLTPLRQSLEDAFVEVIADRESRLRS